MSKRRDCIGVSFPGVVGDALSILVGKRREWETFSQQEQASRMNPCKPKGCSKVAIVAPERRYQPMAVPIFLGSPMSTKRRLSGQMSGAARCDGLGRPEQPINFGADCVEFPLQRLVSFNCVAADFLIDIGGHSGQICNVSLEAGLAITHRLS